MSNTIVTETAPGELFLYSDMLSIAKKQNKKQGLIKFLGLVQHIYIEALYYYYYNTYTLSAKGILVYTYVLQNRCFYMYATKSPSLMNDPAIHTIENV